MKQFLPQIANPLRNDRRFVAWNPSLAGTCLDDLLSRPATYGGNENAGCAGLVTEGLRCVQRGKALTDQLVAFARQKPLAVQRINLNNAVKQIMPLIERTVGGKVPVTLELEDSLYDCYGDVSQIEAALLNLAKKR